MSLEHWEAYYRSGALATCPIGPAGEFDLELREAWVGFFSGLPDQARILDVGTGNGIVAMIARETAASLGRQYEIHATDLARIDPVRHVPDGARRLAGIRFHPGVATEALPFEAGSFDAVSGHYALEYMRADAALAQTRRVLKPAGRAQFVLHHADSLLVDNARQSLSQAELVLKETKVYRRLERFVAAERKSPDVVRRARQELGVAVEALQQAARESGNPLVLQVTLDAVQKLLLARTRLKPAALDREIHRVEQDLRASVRRLNDLVLRARSDADMAEIERNAVAAGFDLVERALQFHAGENLVGWRLTLAAGAAVGAASAATGVCG